MLQPRHGEWTPRDCTARCKHHFFNIYSCVFLFSQNGNLVMHVSSRPCLGCMWSMHISHKGSYRFNVFTSENQLLFILCTGAFQIQTEIENAFINNIILVLTEISNLNNVCYVVVNVL